MLLTNCRLHSSQLNLHGNYYLNNPELHGPDFGRLIGVVSYVHEVVQLGSVNLFNLDYEKSE